MSGYKRRTSHSAVPPLAVFTMNLLNLRCQEHTHMFVSIAISIVIHAKADTYSKFPDSLSIATCLPLFDAEVRADRSVCLAVGAASSGFCVVVCFDA